MAHLVRYRTASGEVATDEVNDLEAAVAHVERLRNDERAEDVRVYAEVALRVETYVRVTVADAAPAEVAPVEAAPVEPAPVDEAPLDDDAPVASDADATVPAAPVDPPPGAMLPPLRVEAPSADGDDLVEAGEPVTRGRGLFHR